MTKIRRLSQISICKGKHSNKRLSKHYWESPSFGPATAKRCRNSPISVARRPGPAGVSGARERSAGLCPPGRLQALCFLCRRRPRRADWVLGPWSHVSLVVSWTQSLGVHPQSSGSDCLWFSVTEGARKPEKVPQCWEAEERNAGLSAAAHGEASCAHSTVSRARCPATCKGPMGHPQTASGVSQTWALAWQLAELWRDADPQGPQTRAGFGQRLPLAPCPWPFWSWLPRQNQPREHLSRTDIRAFAM